MLKNVDEETHYQLLKHLEDNPNISQRQLANKMGISLGKVNYCLKALIDVGQIKLNNFAGSKNKLGYVYLLTPKGIKEKTQVTKRFLKIKQQQYDMIKKDIDTLQKELSNAASN